MTAPGLRPICDHGRCQQILAAFAQARAALVTQQAEVTCGWLEAAIVRAGLDEDAKGRLMAGIREVLAEAGEGRRAA